MCCGFPQNRGWLSGRDKQCAARFMLARLAKILGPRDETQIETPDEVTSGTIEIEANMIRDLENFRKMRLGL